MTNGVDATFTTFSATYAGHYHGELRTRGEIEDFLGGAVDMAGPSGERSTAEISTPEGHVALEFALFEDCGYLRRGDDVAVEPSFLNEQGEVRVDVDLPEPRLVHNIMDEVETLEGDRLLCTPGWVRAAVLSYVLTGHFPEQTGWVTVTSSTGDGLEA